MNDPARPFESIESAHEFVELLAESIQEARQEVRDHLEEARAANDERRVAVRALTNNSRYCPAAGLAR